MDRKKGRIKISIEATNNKKKYGRQEARVEQIKDELNEWDEYTNEKCLQFP